MIIKTELMNKPSSWALVMRVPWVPMCSSEGSLGARLRLDVTMNGWDWRRRWRMKRKQGRRGMQCLNLTPNSPRCYGDMGKWPDCSGHNHWITGCRWEEGW